MELSPKGIECPQKGDTKHFKWVSFLKLKAISNLWWTFFFAAIISIFWKFVTLFLMGISLLVLNSIIDVGESVSFLRPIE